MRHLFMTTAPLAVGLLAMTPGRLWAATEPAATEPAGTAGTQDPASAGTEDLEGTGAFGSATTLDDTEGTDATELTISAGALGSTGNARALALTANGNFRLRRGIHQFGAIALANFARAAVAPETDSETTVNNVQGRLRYDVFVHPNVSLFAMATGRHDPFQQLDLRLNVDPGVAFYILNEAKHRLWTEVGYDFQYDVRTDEAVFETNDEGAFIVDADGNRDRVEDRTFTNHAARVFGGYANSINENFTFSTGVEYLQSVLELQRFRVNWDVGLTAQLVNRLSLATTFTLRFDNAPLPGVREVDTITAVSLVYRFF
ncbi:MAG: DUF481 domain-containing protein [Nannocystaceae bacterium]|nr:DUF481 domain-containing protein [Nannocystaceae bacterium]